MTFYYNGATYLIARLVRVGRKPIIIMQGVGPQENYTGSGVKFT